MSGVVSGHYRDMHIYESWYPGNTGTSRSILIQLFCYRATMMIIMQLIRTFDLGLAVGCRSREVVGHFLISSSPPQRHQNCGLHAQPTSHGSAGEGLIVINYVQKGRKKQMHAELVEDAY